MDEIQQVQIAVESSGEWRWRAVEESGGGEQWRETAEESDGGEWWWRLVKESGGGDRQRRAVEESRAEMSKAELEESSRANLSLLGQPARNRDEESTGSVRN